MKSERRGLILIVLVLLVSAALGGVYGPSVRATSNFRRRLPDSRAGNSRASLTSSNPLRRRHSSAALVFAKKRDWRASRNRVRVETRSMQG